MLHILMDALLLPQHSLTYGLSRVGFHEEMAFLFLSDRTYTDRCVPVTQLQHGCVKRLHGGRSDREIYNIWSPDFFGDQSGGGGGRCES